MMYLDIGWMRGGVANSQKKTQSVLPTANTDCRMTECSISDNLSDVSWAHKALAVQKDCTTSIQHPVLGTSLHVISFTRPSPILVLQATNAGVRRPGHEVSPNPLELVLYFSIHAYT